MVSEIFRPRVRKFGTYRLKIKSVYGIKKRWIEIAVDMAPFTAIKSPFSIPYTFSFFAFNGADEIIFNRDRGELMMKAGQCQVVIRKNDDRGTNCPT